MRTRNFRTLATFVHLRGRAITDTLTDLLVDTVHRINAKAERRVDEVLLDDLRRVSGKTNLLFSACRCNAG